MKTKPGIPGLRTALTMFSPAGRRAKLSTLIYHRVLPEPDPLRTGDPDADTFRWQMALLARHFNVLPLPEAARRLRDGTLPARAACVTFDDGYADNFTIALPILQEAGIPATCFVATAYLDGGRMFNDTLIELAARLPDGRHDFSSIGLGERALAGTDDRRALVSALIGKFKYFDPAERAATVEALAASFGVCLPNDLMMSADQLRALHAAGMEIGGHTDTHPILALLDPERAREEILAGRKRLEALIAAPVRVFAYPNGRPGKDYRAEHAALVSQCGFEAAVSTVPTTATTASSAFELPRFTPWDRTPGRFGLRLLHALVTSR
ncbi:MAG: polysaccharide deacetylase family protein [Rhodocyclaceae bacterium]|nr:polysaccharide deacetylase family protein [Rhodocyclaceae bacterium]